MTVHFVGVDYCLTHCGIRNEDDAACDMAEFGADPEDCDLRELAWIES